MHLSQGGINMENGWPYSEEDGNVALNDTSNTYMGYLWPCSVQGHFVVIRRTYSTVFINSKSVGLGDSGMLVEHI